ncbi:MAG TPA: hypothetical protein VLD38_01220 [Nitrosopumilaceae archaeon]|nr:hypothetical protein [Nitrosopumilaceae archaeon]
MKSRKFIPVGIGSAIAIVVIIFVISYFGKSQPSKIDSLSLDFTYDEANSVLKQSLQSQGITMSSPLRFQKQQDIEKWCKFFTDQEKQKLVEYCTSTELKIQNGTFLGNIHLVGSPDAPKLVFVVIQSNPFFDNMNQVKSVFGTVTRELVCDCWESVKPGGYEGIENWIDALRDFHTSGSKPHSESNSVPLASKHMQIQLTTTKEGYVWEMLIAR